MGNKRKRPDDSIPHDASEIADGGAGAHPTKKLRRSGRIVMKPKRLDL